VGILLLLLVVLSEAVFGGWLTISARNYPIAFICGAIVIWTAFRFTQRETATGIFILSAIAIWGTLHGFGPFVGETENQSLLALQSWTAVLTITAMALSAGVAERRRADEALRESEARMSIAANAANLGLWLWNIRDDKLWVTEQWRRLFGFAESEPVNFGRWLQLVHPEDRERTKQLVQHMFEGGGGEYENEYRITWPDGSIRWIAGYGSVELDERGKLAFARGVSRDITKRKIAEEELRESEARFRTVADSAPVLIWMSGPDKLCTFFNKGWLEFTGRTMEQELGKGWTEGVHADDLDRCLDVYQNSFNARQPFTMEYRLRRNDGEYRWVLDNGTPRFASDGAFLGYIGSCVGITERKLAEEKFRLVIDAAPNAMIMVDSAGVISFANAPAATVFAYSLSELIGRHIETLIPERFRDRHLGYRKGFLSEPSIRAMGAGRDLFGRRKDGSEFPVEVGLNPIHTTEGLFVLASVIDITERKHAELAVRQSEERLRLVIDTALDAVITIDAHGAITHWNAEAEKIFGWTKAEATGRKLSEIIIPLQHRAAHERGLRHYHDTGAGPMLGKRIEITALHRGGREFPVELAITPAVIEGCVYFTAFISDITARKQAELAHQLQNMELARVGRVAVMGELAASLAHEVNNPIGAIVANASAGQRLLAAGKLGTEELTELLADIVADGHRAGEIIQGIRNMVRKGEARRSLIPIGDKIRHLLRFVHADAIGRDVKVTAKVGPDAGQVWGDPVQLLQVLLNLSLNALEAMSAVPPDARRLLIRAGRDGNGDILVSVRDSGPGFPSGMAEKLFEPFFSTKPEGIGMGLAISRSIIEAHGGTLSGENCDGGGACFTVRLPQAKEDNSRAG
jgi:two-component system sensor kinase FixL